MAGFLNPKSSETVCYFFHILFCACLGHGSFHPVEFFIFPANRFGGLRRDMSYDFVSLTPPKVRNLITKLVIFNSIVARIHNQKIHNPNSTNPCDLPVPEYSGRGGPFLAGAVHLIRQI